MMSFEEIEGLQSKVEIVVNRAGLDSGQISLKKAKDTLGREVFALLPNDYRTMVEVRNNGVPLIVQAPKAAITQAIRDLATKLQGNSEETAEGDEADGKGNESKWKKFWPGTSEGLTQSFAPVRFFSPALFPVSPADPSLGLDPTHQRPDHHAGCPGIAMRFRTVCKRRSSDVNVDPGDITDEVL